MITSFTQLIVWQEAHKLVLLIYKITDDFPKKELYILTAQILRAAISITSNIAEGFTRKGKAEKKQFYYTAKASLTEVHNQAIIARDINYISVQKFQEIETQIEIVSKLLRGFINGVDNLIV